MPVNSASDAVWVLMETTSGCIGPPSPSLPCQEMALVNQNPRRLTDPIRHCKVVLFSGGSSRTARPVLHFFFYREEEPPPPPPHWTPSPPPLLQTEVTIAISCGELKATFGSGLVCAAVAARQSNLR